MQKNVPIAGIVYTGSESTKRWLEKECSDIRSYTCLNALFGAETIDAVVIATPIETHFAIADFALSRGVKIFVEKPMCFRPEESLDLITKYGSENIFVGFTFLFHPAWQTLLSVLKNTKIVSIHMEWDKFGSFRESIIQNLLSHELSLIKSLYPEIQTFRVKKNIINRDDLEINAESPNLSELKIKINRRKNIKRKMLCILDEKGRHWIWENSSLFCREKTQYSLVPLPSVSSLEAECSTMLDWAKGNYPAFCDGEFGSRIDYCLSQLEERKSYVEL